MFRELVRSSVKKAIGKVMGTSAPPPPPPAPAWRARAPETPAPVAPVEVAAAPVPVAPVEVEAAPVPDAPVEVEAAPAQVAPVEAEAAPAPVASVEVEAAPAPAKKGRGKKKATADVAPVEAAPAEPAPVEAAPVQPAAVEAAPAVAPAPAVAHVPADDTVGPPLSMEELQAFIDEYVRPALQSDGGDMTLVKVEQNDVYVKLVGSCKTCPSSTVTLRMGVENTLKEEFPQMRELIQVD